jgi:tRNA modification GTPase
VSDTTVSLLTPPGTGAIATVEVSGPRAWELAKQLFTPAGKPLPAEPEVNRFWLGTLGSDEVILAVTAAYGVAVEVHCHGGRRGVRWVIDQFVARGCIENPTPRPEGEGLGSGEAFQLLQHAPTLRTASILLDQAHGQFATAVQAILYFLEHTPAAAPAFLRQLARFAPAGRHLVEPWKVVVAGPPNVGKSSLVNALAGYQRSVVSEVAGTTRDAVRVRVALDGWPVELIDTAGLRDASGLEAEGIERARRELEEADLVLWVMDATRPAVPPPSPLAVWNKSDLVREPPSGLAVSALTGAGLPALVAEITSWLVPHPPPPGVAVPFTPRLADLVEGAHAALGEGRTEEAARLLRDCLPAR